jgi:hypothetical protein
LAAKSFRHLDFGDFRHGEPSIDEFQRVGKKSILADGLLRGFQLWLGHVPMKMQ